MAVSEFFDRHPVSDGSLVLVALSGGADSLALAAATRFVAAKRGLRVGAVIVDHGLQQGSAELAVSVSEKAMSLGLYPVEVVHVVVGTEGGPEAAARDARYAALRAATERHGAAVVLTGHTRNDQAETVLLGLARGSGPGSLRGMAELDGLIGRPFLDVTREVTRAASLAEGLEPWVGHLLASFLILLCERPARGSSARALFFVLVVYKRTPRAAVLVTLKPKMTATWAPHLVKYAAGRRVLRL